MPLAETATSAELIRVAKALQRLEPAAAWLCEAAAGRPPGGAAADAFERALTELSRG